MRSGYNARLRDFLQRLTLVRSRSLLYLLTITPLLLALSAPLVVHSGLYFPFVSGKVFYFRTLVAVALGFYVLLALRYPEFRVRPGRIVCCVGLFLGVQLSAALLGVDQSRSLWGDLERGEGILTLLHLIIFGVLLAVLMRSQEDRQAVLTVWLLVAVVVVVFALLEVARSPASHRPEATLGNPTFLGSYMLLSVFIGLWNYASSRSAPVRAVSLFLTTGFVATLLLTATRSALAGTVAGVAAILAGLWIRIGIRSRQRLSGLLLILLAVCLSAIAISLETRQVNFLIFQRLASITLESGTPKFRLLTWNAAVEAFRDRPLLGYGPENFSVAFNAHFPPELYTLSPRETLVDRAHNSLLDAALTSGVIGVAALLALYGAILVSLARRWFECRHTPSWILACAFLGCFLDSLFAVSGLASQIGFWLLVGCCASFEKDHGISIAMEGRPLVRAPAVVPVAGVFVFLAVALWQFNLKPALACRELAEGGRFAKQDRDAAMHHFASAIGMESYLVVDARKVAAETVLGWFEMREDGFGVRKEHSDFVIRELETAIDDHPLDFKSRILLTMLYNRTASNLPARIGLALANAREAIRLAPSHPTPHFEEGQANLQRKNFAEALNSFRNAVNLVPGSFDARWNLAVALVVAGRQSEAEAEFEELRSRGFDLGEARLLQRLLAAYQAAGRSEKIPPLREELRVLQSANP